MEFALPQLLTRDDILAILNQRQLQIRNLNELTHEELLRVYNTFVMPLSQRPERSKRTPANTPCTFPAHSNTPARYDEQMCTEPFHADNTCTSMDIDLPHMTMMTNHDGQVGTHDKMTSPLGEKRRQRESDDEFIATEKDYQYLLSSATKRIKINSLY